MSPSHFSHLPQRPAGGQCMGCTPTPPQPSLPHQGTGQPSPALAAGVLRPASKGPVVETNTVPPPQGTRQTGRSLPPQPAARGPRLPWLTPYPGGQVPCVHSEAPCPGRCPGGGHCRGPRLMGRGPARPILQLRCPWPLLCSAHLHPTLCFWLALGGAWRAHLHRKTRLHAHT